VSDQATASRLTIAIEHSPNVAVVRCRGRLVAGVNDQFYLEVKQLLPGCQRLVLDLADLTHMDSSGLGTLVRLYVSAKSAGCVLELNNIGKPIRQLLGVTHLLSVFESVGENRIRMG
jgi:anti-anti-sigma factor